MPFLLFLQSLDFRIIFLRIFLLFLGLLDFLNSKVYLFLLILFVLKLLPFRISIAVAVFVYTTTSVVNVKCFFDYMAVIRMCSNMFLRLLQVYILFIRHYSFPRRPKFSQ